MNPTLKQHLTELYDWSIGIIAPLKRRGVWSTLDSRLAKYKYNVAHLATINYCNAKCNFCGQHKFKRPSGVMSLETFRNLLHDFRKLEIKEIDFTPPLGDPLLDDTLLEKASLAKEAGFTTSITTNGIKLSGQNYRAIVNNIDNIRISLGGCTRAEYKEIYGVDKFDNVVTWILEMAKYIAFINHSFKEYNPQKNILIFFRASSTWKEIKNSLLMEHLAPHIKNGYLKVEYTNLYDNWGGSIKPEDMIGEMKMRSEKKKRGVPCQSLSQFFIEHQGNVRLCGCRFKDKEKDDLCVGNLNERKLNDILAPQNIRKVYDMFRADNQLPDVCEKCTLYRPIL